MAINQGEKEDASFLQCIARQVKNRTVIRRYVFTACYVVAFLWVCLSVCPSVWPSNLVERREMAMCLWLYRIQHLSESSPLL